MSSKLRRREWWPVCVVMSLVLAVGCEQKKPRDDDAFLAEVRRTAETAPAAGFEAATEPGTTEDPGAVPIIEVSTVDLDVGEVAVTEIGKGQVTVRNVGKADLIVADIKTSCGCTVGKMGKKQLAPGEETTLDVMVDPKRVYGFESTKTLTIFSNDPRQRTVEVKVHAKVKPEFFLEPEHVQFSTIEKGETSQQTVILRQAGDEELRLLSAEAQATADWLEVSYEELPKDQWREPGKREYAIHLAIKPTAPVGSLATNVLLKPDLVRFKRYMIPVSATVTSFYSMQPTVVNLGAVVPGTTITNVLRLASGESIEIVSVEVTPGPGMEPWVNLTPHAIGTDNFIGFDATIAENVSPGAKSSVAELVIRGDEKQITEHIKVHGAIQQGQPAEPVTPASQELKPVLVAPPPAIASAGSE